jgi:hypothetical protein
VSIRARQFALVQNTATNLVPIGSFPNQVGAVQMPVQVFLKNEDPTAEMWIGGPDVDATHGSSLPPGASLPMSLYSGDIPWGFTTSGASPIISVMVGGQ